MLLTSSKKHNNIMTIGYITNGHKNYGGVNNESN